MAFELGATPSSTTGVHTNAALDQAYYNKNQSSLSSMLSRLSACDDPRAKGDAQMIGHLQEQALHMEQQLTHMQAALQNERQQAAEQQMRLNREVEMARRNQLDRHPDGSLKPMAVGAQYRNPTVSNCTVASAVICGIPLCIFILAVVFGAIMAGIESQPIMHGTRYTLGNLVGVGTPLTTFVPSSNGGKAVDVVLATLSLSVVAIVIGVIGNFRFVQATAQYIEGGVKESDASLGRLEREMLELKTLLRQQSIQIQSFGGVAGANLSMQGVPHQSPSVLGQRLGQDGMMAAFGSPNGMTSPNGMSLAQRTGSGLNGQLTPGGSMRQSTSNGLGVLGTAAAQQQGNPYQQEQLRSSTPAGNPYHQQQPGAPGNPTGLPSFQPAAAAGAPALTNRSSFGL